MKATVIYEVNLSVQPSVADKFAEWLPEHIQQILQLEGFISAEWFVRQAADEGVPATGDALWTVHYRLKDRASLDNYLKNYAAAMREEGKRAFGDKFTAQRRILSLKRSPS